MVCYSAIIPLALLDGNFANRLVGERNLFLESFKRYARAGRKRNLGRPCADTVVQP